MKRTRHTPEQVIRKLRDAERMLAEEEPHHKTATPEPEPHPARPSSYGIGVRGAEP